MIGRMDELKNALGAKGIETGDIRVALKNRDQHSTASLLTDSARLPESQDSGPAAAGRAEYFHFTLSSP